MCIRNIIRFLLGLIILSVPVFGFAVYQDMSKEPVAEEGELSLYELTQQAISSLESGDTNLYDQSLYHIKQKVDAGADVNQPEDDYISRILHLCIRYDAEELTWYYIEKGAYLDRKDSSGNTALTWAASKGNYKLVVFLIEKGVRIDPVNTSKMTPLAYAQKYRHKEIADYLIRHGADPDHPLLLMAKKEKKKAQKKKVGNFISYFAVPLIYTGLSVYLYESRFLHKPQDNWMAGINAYTISISASMLTGALIGTALWPADSGFLGELAKFNGTIVGAFIGIPVGIILAATLDFKTAFQNKRGLYYLAPAISLSIPIISYSLTF